MPKSIVVGVTMAIIAAMAIWSSTFASAHDAPHAIAPRDLDGHFPVGTPDNLEPSGEAPPSATAMVGYSMIYQNDFLGDTLPPGWYIFTGVPGGDPGGHFGVSHVQVNGGTLNLTTFRDPAWHDRWVTGGLCQCGLKRRYGAYFVRSRITGAGLDEAELLWPANNVWPPEIDFNETGANASSTGTSVHFGAKNHIVHSRISIDMTQWHTWGVIWTPTSIVYTVDGRVWGRFTARSEIPDVPMTLDFEQRQQCEEHRLCPTASEAMEIDWVAEYAQSGIG